MKVSVIIPTINEEEAIGDTVRLIKKSFGNQFDYEILVVDTNSTDKTVQIAKQCGAKVVVEPSRGYGRAYKTGFKHASGDLIATVDADGTYPIKDIIILVRKLEKYNLDFICGVRRNLKSSMSLKHRLGNRFITLVTNILFNIRLKDSQSGMWVFRKQILNKLKLVNNFWPFSGEIKIEAIKNGFRFKEIPIKYNRRIGESKVDSWEVGMQNIIFLFKKFLFYN